MAEINMVCVGVNHRTAPVQIRERFALSTVEAIEFMNGLVGNGVIREVVVLSTCNRVEVYFLCADSSSGIHMVREALERRSGMTEADRKLFYTHESSECIQHLYEVTAGLDSMVVGETEILGQVKEAYKMALESHRTSIALNRLFQNSFSVAKEIRSQTRIGTGSVSVGSVAVDLASQIFGELKTRKVLLLGAGEMGENTARFLKGRGAGAMKISNRSPEKAEKLASQLGAEVILWDQWKDACRDIDIIILCTASPQPLLNGQELNPIMQKRRGTPLFLIDLCVPRNVDREVSGIRGVYLYDMDDLQVIADQNLALRQGEMAVCRQIIRAHADLFLKWFHAHRLQIARCPTARKMEGLKKSLSLNHA